MKVFKIAKDSQFECDECDSKPRRGDKMVLIGEHSTLGFEEDTRQALLCMECLKKALIETSSDDQG